MGESARQTLFDAGAAFITEAALEMLITLDVPPSRDRAPFSKSPKKAAVTKKGANVLILKIECHPSKVSSSYGILPSAKYPYFFSPKSGSLRGAAIPALYSIFWHQSWIPRRRGLLVNENVQSSFFLLDDLHAALDTFLIDNIHN